MAYKKNLKQRADITPTWPRTLLSKNVYINQGFVIDKADFFLSNPQKMDVG